MCNKYWLIFVKVCRNPNKLIPQEMFKKKGGDSMSKLVKMVTTALVFTVILTLAVAGAAFAANADSSGLGPAPNSHDGIPDGPGWEEEGITIPNGPNN